jgi:serine protease AprX
MPTRRFSLAGGESGSSAGINQHSVEYRESRRSPGMGGRLSGQGVVVGGQDTGYQWDHPAIKSQYRGWDGVEADHAYSWHDAIHEDLGSLDLNHCGFDSPVPCDDHGHGTHTMGTIVGGADNVGTQIGVAPGARWIGCRNMENGWGTPATYSECYEWFMAPYPPE